MTLAGTLFDVQPIGYTDAQWDVIRALPDAVHHERARTPGVVYFTVGRWAYGYVKPDGSSECHLGEGVR